MNTTASSQGSRSAACHFSSRHHLDRLLPEPIRTLPVGANLTDDRLAVRLGGPLPIRRVLEILASNLNQEAGQ